MSEPDLPVVPMKVLCLGLPRTGTFSMYQALRTLGYGPVHHGLADGMSPKLDEWRVWSRACDASFPTLPSYTGRPLARAEWDELLGPYEAVTDIASLFGEQLVLAYPEARVVLVERADVDRWEASAGEVLDSMFGAAAEFFITRVEPWMGTLAGPVSRKMWLGWCEARDGAEARRNLRRRYRAHYDRIRELVPEANRLDYRLGDGWGPLCDFLGRDPRPPGTEFPRTNDAEAFRQFVIDSAKQNVTKALVMFAPWALGAGVAAYALVASVRNGWWWW